MESFSPLLALCEGNSPVTGEIPLQRPVTRSFDVFFDLRLNKPLSKQLRRRWFETHCAHYDVTVMRKSTFVFTHCNTFKNWDPVEEFFGDLTHWGRVIYIYISSSKSSTKMRRKMSSAGILSRPQNDNSHVICLDGNSVSVCMLSNGHQGDVLCKCVKKQSIWLTLYVYFTLYVYLTMLSVKTNTQNIEPHSLLELKHITPYTSNMIFSTF